MTWPCAAPTLFRMDTKQRATQAAMAAEIGARLGRMNRSKAWLHREAGISASAWRYYFTALQRDVPLSVIQKVASKLGTTTGELIAAAEHDAPLYLPGITDAEREAMRQTLNGAPHTPDSPVDQERLTGS